MATEKSLSELTIGELAKASGMSKSGLFAHFKSKEKLQISVVEHAIELFTEKVIKQVSREADPLSQLKQLVQHWIDWYVGNANSCLFLVAIVEFEQRPGAVRELLLEQQSRWISYLKKRVAAIVDSEQFRAETDVEQFVFELYALFVGSQKFSWLGLENYKHQRFEKGFQRLVEQSSQ